MKKIAVVGYKGKMGAPIFLSLQKKFDVVGIGRDDLLDEYDDIDLVIDVASGSSSVKSAEYCLKKKIPIIIASTGQNENESARIDEIAKSIKIIRKSNFSQGFEICKKFIDEILKYNPDNISILERHHIQKKDSPSGTALELKKYIESRYVKDVHIYSIREGNVKGEHTLIIQMGNEEIIIKHNVFSRQVFVDGLIKEAEKLLK